MSSYRTVQGLAVETFYVIHIVEEEPEVVSRPVLVNPPRKKCMAGQVVLAEKIFKATHDVKASRYCSTTIFPRYIPPQKDDTLMLSFKIMQNIHW